MYAENNLTSYIELQCINDPGGGNPYWYPPYDHEINPFPVCVTVGKYAYNSYNDVGGTLPKASRKFVVGM